MSSRTRTDAACVKNASTVSLVPFWWVACAVIIVAALFVFSDHVFGDTTFIGDFDRLNSYLNIRLFEYDSIRAYGRVPLWNEGMFAGFSMAGLHWMNPVGDPVPWFLTLFGRDSLFRVLGYVSIASVALTTLFAYLYIKDITRPGLPAISGAILYGLSVFSLHRAAQVDNAHLTLMLLPLGLLAIRRAARATLLRSYLLLCLVLALLVFYGFLQEVGYVLIYFAAYALYRAGVAFGRGNRDCLLPLAVFATAALAAVILAAPRLITVAGDIQLLSRTQTFFQTDFSEIVRLLHEGLMGRYLAEGYALGNGTNLHEGLQLLGSSFAVLIVLFCLGRPGTAAELGGAVLVAAICGIVFAGAKYPYIFFSDLFPGISPEGAAFVTNLVLLIAAAALVTFVERWRHRAAGATGSFSSISSDRARSVDANFHIWVLGIVLVVVLVSEVRYGLYWLFGSMDFTHSRVSLLATMALAALFAIYMEWLGRVVSQEPAPAGNVTVVVVGLLFGLLIAWVVHGGLVDRLIEAGKPVVKISSNHLSTVVLIKVGLTLAVLVSGFAVGFGSLRHRQFSLIVALWAAACGFAIGETVTYGKFKISGDHTRTYPVPFKSNSYLTVQQGLLRPPSPDAVSAVADRLESDNFRSATVSAWSRYPSFTSPHISQFWRLRLLGGYGAGVPARLASLPWPDGVRGLRSLEFSSMDQLSPGLLAMLNVKYFIHVDGGLYFNTGAGAALPGSLRVRENPVRAVPRQYLAKSVTAIAGLPEVTVARADGAVRFNGGDVDILASPLVEGIGGVPATEFDTSGELSVDYRGDRIDAAVEPSGKERFLVLNELYHPSWRAYADGSEIEVFPANLVMRGVRLPPHTKSIQFRFEPFSASGSAKVIQILALLLFVGGGWVLYRGPFKQDT